MVSKLERLHKQIAALEKQKSAVVSKEKFTAVKQINTQISLYGITPTDLSFSGKAPAKPRATTPKPKSKTAGRKVAIKYRQGEATWTGRGRQPKWVVDFLAGGGKIEELLVTA